MLLLLLTFLQDVLGVKIPAVFTYSSTRMALASITSLLTVLIFGKHFIKKLYEWKIGDRVRMEECPLLGTLHKNKNDTPTMGGILILFSLIISLLLWMDLHSIFTLILLLTTVFMGGIGAYDDYLKLRHKNKKGLSAKKKFGLQTLFSALIAFYLLVPSFNEALHFQNWFSPPTAIDHKTLLTPTSPSAVHHTEEAPTTVVKAAMLTAKEYALRLYVPFVKKPVILGHAAFLIPMVLFLCFVIVGSSNAVNLTDGLDGLATGLVIFASGAFALIAFVSNNQEIAGYLQILYIAGSGEIAIYLAAVLGASLGFLWYNSHPAQVFMGDTGSLALGGILGVASVLLKRELLFAIIGGVFVVEALSVILQVGSYKLRNKKRIFLCAPIHHHFEYKGWPETKVVLRFWIIGLLLAMVGVITLKFQ